MVFEETGIEGYFMRRGKGTGRVVALALDPKWTSVDPEFQNSNLGFSSAANRRRGNDSGDVISMTVQEECLCLFLQGDGHNYLRGRPCWKRLQYF